MKKILERMTLAAGRLMGRGEHAKQRVVDDVERRAAQLQSEAQSLIEEGRRQHAHLKTTFSAARREGLNEARRADASARGGSSQAGKR